MLREVAASRRVCGKAALNLSHILQLATGSPEEPVLGFTLAPSLEFILLTELKVTSQQGLSKGQHLNLKVRQSINKKSTGAMASLESI